MANFVFRELEKNESFDPLTIHSDAPFTQAQFYGKWQEGLGREVRRFVILKDREVFAYFQLIKCPLFYHKSYFYIPYGPIIKEFSEQFLNLLQIELCAIARKNNAVFVRLDFTPPAESDEYKKLLAIFFTKSSRWTYQAAYFQPRAEWFLDLRKSEVELLKEMRKGTRYSIHLADRKGRPGKI